MLIDVWTCIALVRAALVVHGMGGLGCMWAGSVKVFENTIPSLCRRFHADYLAGRKRLLPPARSRIYY